MVWIFPRGERWVVLRYGRGACEYAHPMRVSVYACACMRAFWYVCKCVSVCICVCVVFVLYVYMCAYVCMFACVMCACVYTCV